LAGVEKERRAPTVSVLLLALSEFPDLRLGTDSDVFIQDINIRAEKISRIQKRNIFGNK